MPGDVEGGFSVVHGEVSQPIGTGHEAAMSIAGQPEQLALFQFDNAEFGVKLTGTLQHNNEHIKIRADVHTDFDMRW